MHQVIFWIPLHTRWTPEGIPLYGFGLMLVLAFICGGAYLGFRAKELGMTNERMQDLALWLLVTGLCGARIVYMIQYKRPVTEFFKIWEGGIVFYGSVIGGWFGYWAFYYYMKNRKKFVLPTWRIADTIAPALAIGTAFGRLGCFLNGCCYGQAACPECPQVHFPMLTTPARDQLVLENGYQTSVGFAIAPPIAWLSEGKVDPRTVVLAVEPNSPAAMAGLKAGDRIIGLRGQVNSILVEVMDSPDVLVKVLKWAQTKGNVIRTTPTESNPEELRKIPRVRLMFATFPAYRDNWPELRTLVPQRERLAVTDFFSEFVANPPKGEQSLALQVERGEQRIDLAPFVPRSIGLFPTQIYETVSMLLICGVLLSYLPFRRHDGQVFVLFLMMYAVHRFINEVIRNDTPSYFYGLTLSMSISLGIFLFAIGLEIYLRQIQPRRGDPVAGPVE